VKSQIKAIKQGRELSQEEKSREAQRQKNPPDVSANWKPPFAASSAGTPGSTEVSGSEISQQSLGRGRWKRSLLQSTGAESKKKREGLGRRTRKILQRNFRATLWYIQTSRSRLDREGFSRTLPRSNTRKKLVNRSTENRERCRPGGCGLLPGHRDRDLPFRRKREISKVNLGRVLFPQNHHVKCRL